ncbi:MAG: MGMT family protein [Candidatus Nealsonbacteria bacterium]|nr:MGMT family protein [Candidatus Nealsonbacteria bacterium]
MPCYWVIREDGKIAGFRNGTKKKKILLEKRRS